MNLDTSIQYLKGVGPKIAKRLKKLGIEKIGDLVLYFPRTWIDFSQTIPIRLARVGQEVIIKGKILEISNIRSPKKRMVITSAKISDRVGDDIKVVWFGQPYLIQNLHVGSEWIFLGKIGFDYQAHEKILQSPIYEKNEKILPVYSETEGITSRYLRRLITSLLSNKNDIPQDFLPEKIIKSENLVNLEEAINQIHFPTSNFNLSLAKTRLAFDEIFLIVLRMLVIKHNLQVQKSPIVKINKNLLKEFVDKLPYKLTNAQRKASWEIISDLSKSVPMNRLLNGDVGSGKTVVATMAALNCIKAATPATPEHSDGGRGYQVAWMAPTEILANQHYENVSELLKLFGVKVALLTSNQAKISECKVQSAKCKIKVKNLKLKSYKLQAHKLIASCDLIIGTHALIQEGVKFKNLGLVIIDEQHRFGVQQRAALHPKKLNEANKLIPHFLSMTATPIPRTLTLSIYGDLDVSVLDEMPLGRQKTITKLVDSTKRKLAYEFIRNQIKSGRQAFVVCPLIEENNDKRLAINNKLFDLDRKSVKKEYEKLSKEIFSEFKIGILHGKMRPNEKEKTMADFTKGKIEILVSTSVVEVGIDVSNATVMMIEDADRFGLAQLHQFRGRVGRGKQQSYCLLFTNNLSVETNKRLKALTECSDGFKLAQKDLEIRGPGELTGIQQSGLPDLKMATLTDIILIKKVRAVTEKIIDDGLEKYPLLVKKLKEFDAERHLE